MTFSAIIPTYMRGETLLGTLEKLLNCSPPPSEILVHVDAGDEVTAPLVKSKYPQVRVISSDETQGPGGGRNKLTREATLEFVASFDDDSWPIGQGFFRDAKLVLDENPNVALLACNIIERDEKPPDFDEPLLTLPPKVASGFVGCGCVFRKSAFLQTSGYLPLRYAYGMEETDLSLQLYDLGWTIGFCDSMRVLHDCDRNQHHASREINAAQITNTALLAYLRYPIQFWPLGFAQTTNRVLYSIRNKRFRGIARGLLAILPALWRNRKKRAPVSAVAFRRWRTIKTT